ncbi:hypothetical protein PspLS_08094 [Pyricularia sp. CBS 133598]|nr:hypothetical protein PspLS_08094 [Pyricularia sp. CBS 133598]
MATVVAKSTSPDVGDTDGGVRIDFLDYVKQNAAAADANAVISKKVVFTSMKTANRPLDPTTSPFDPLLGDGDVDVRRPVGKLPGSQSVPNILGSLQNQNNYQQAQTVTFDSQSTYEDSNSLFSTVSQQAAAPAPYNVADGPLYTPDAQASISALYPQAQKDHAPMVNQMYNPGQHDKSGMLQMALRPAVDHISEHVRSQRSQALNRLTSGPTGRPSAVEALDSNNFPFVETARVVAPDACTNGVVKLKNIPFATRRVEIIAFLGRNSKILNDNLEPVHIIMERVTSKTMDAYVEFVTLQDAIKAVDKHQATITRGRLSRLGDRPIEVELSSQGALMKDLFPSAKGVFWEGIRPTIKPFKPNEPWENFKGFINDEEMTMLVKHVEVPQRSPFSRDCPQRPYECMISTIRKLPWPMTELITLRQRHAIYNACFSLIRLLSSAIAHGRQEEILNEPLRKRLVHAAMTCPGFTVVQKDNIATIVDMSEARRLEYGLPRFASSCLHLYALSPKANFPLDMIEYYIAIIREETTRLANSLPLKERTLVTSYGRDTDLYFGYLWWELQLPRNDRFDGMTLAEAAALEYAVMERIICRAFGGGSSNNVAGVITY